MNNATNSRPIPTAPAAMMRKTKGSERRRKRQATVSAPPAPPPQTFQPPVFMPTIPSNPYFSVPHFMMHFDSTGDFPGAEQHFQAPHMGFASAGSYMQAPQAYQYPDGTTYYQYQQNEWEVEVEVSSKTGQKRSNDDQTIESYSSPSKKARHRKGSTVSNRDSTGLSTSAPLRDKTQIQPSNVELRATLQCKMDEVKNLFSQLDGAKTPEEKKQLMILAKQKNCEMEAANAAVQASNQAHAIQHTQTLSTVIATADAGPSTASSESLAYTSARLSSQQAWRYSQVRTDPSFGETRFINMASPETYVIEWSDDDEDMEDIEV